MRLYLFREGWPLAVSRPEMLHLGRLGAVPGKDGDGSPRYRRRVRASLYEFRVVTRKECLSSLVWGTKGFFCC